MDLVSQLYLADITVSKYLNITMSLRNNLQDACLESIRDVPDLMRWIKTKTKFDAVVGMSWPMTSCVGFVAHLLDAKLIQFFSTGPYSLTLRSTGNAYNQLVFPSVGNSYFLEPLTFFQKILNVMNNWGMNYLAFSVMKDELNLMRKEFQDLPSRYEDYFETRSVLSLINSNVVTQGTWPMYPNTIEVGGIHIKPGCIQNTLYQNP